MAYPPPNENRWVGLSADPLPVAEVHAFLRGERAGGVCVFVGTTRRWTGEAETEYLVYEAYEAMATAELHRLVDEAARRWPVLSCAVLHRLEAVAVTEASVIVGVACAHRDAAFAACRWLIDTLKTEVPIWKREAFGDGQSAWIGSSL